VSEAEALATKDSARVASATLNRCTGVDFQSPLKSVFRLAGILQVLVLPVAGLPTSDGRPLPDPLDMPFACEHVQIDQISHPPASPSASSDRARCRRGSRRRMHRAPPR